MRLPKRVVICDHTYEVIRVTSRTPRGLIPKEWSEEHFGYFETDPIARIWVRALPKNPERELGSFVHEILHAALDASGSGRFLRGGIKNEEDFLHTFTPALITALRSARIIR